MNTSLAKMAMFAFNILYLLFGATSLGLGIWIVISKSELFRFINTIDEVDIGSAANQHGLMLAAGYILVVIGSLMLLIGYCGCCGAVKESKHLLICYAVLVGLGLGVQLAVAVIAGVFQGHVRASAEAGLLDLQDRMFVAMPDYLSGQISEDDKTVTILINYLQITFECCGARTAGDIGQSSSWLASNRSWEGRELQLPITCCQVRPDQTSAAISPNFDWADNLKGTLVDEDCPFTGSSRHSKTCYPSIADFAKRCAVPIIVVASLIAFIEIFGIFIAFYLIREINSKRLILNNPKVQHALVCK